MGGETDEYIGKVYSKTGAFKSKLRAGGARVRTQARMQERAKVEAEAKLGVDLRETKRELRRTRMEKTEVEKDAQDSLRRQEQEARKAERDLTVVHI